MAIAPLPTPWWATQSHVPTRQLSWLQHNSTRQLHGYLGWCKLRWQPALLSKHHSRDTAAAAWQRVLTELGRYSCRQPHEAAGRAIKNIEACWQCCLWPATAAGSWLAGWVRGSAHCCTPCLLLFLRLAGVLQLLRLQWRLQLLASPATKCTGAAAQPASKPCPARCG